MIWDYQWVNNQSLCVFQSWSLSMAKLLTICIDITLCNNIKFCFGFWKMRDFCSILVFHICSCITFSSMISVPCWCTYFRNNRYVKIYSKLESTVLIHLYNNVGCNFFWTFQAFELLKIFCLHTYLIYYVFQIEY